MKANMFSDIGKETVAGRRYFLRLSAEPWGYRQGYAADGRLEMVSG